MAVTTSELTERTLAHYRDAFARHGATPQGVDWNGAESQRLHFEQLTKLLPEGRSFSLNDWGCGYGALADLLLAEPARWPGLAYRGVDVSTAMIEAARERLAGRPGVSFDVADEPREPADFGVASGIFTLRLERSDAECAEALARSLDVLDRTSRRGFGFNCLTSYSDPPRMRGYLYYPDPCILFDLCKRRYAKDVALLHDYGLYAFTILVRKAP